MEIWKLDPQVYGWVNPKRAPKGRCNEHCALLLSQSDLSITAGDKQRKALMGRKQLRKSVWLLNHQKE